MRENADKKLNIGIQTIVSPSINMRISGYLLSVMGTLGKEFLEEIQLCMTWVLKTRQQAQDGVIYTKPTSPNWDLIVVLALPEVES